MMNFITPLKNRILTRYIKSNGDEVDSPNNSVDDTRGIKFPPDPSTHGTFHGSDFPFIRYVDILLSRAEALNELNGPNQESIDLINEIRDRAKLDDISPGDYPSKESLRNHILDERKWEFWNEGKRRRDLLRAGQYIENAQNRGKDAREKHKVFPVPQAEINANPLFEQNSGY